MTGEIAQKGITVLPCRVGHVTMPPTLTDKLYLAIDPDDIDAAIATLNRDMRRHLAPSHPLPKRKRSHASTRRSSRPPGKTSPEGSRLRYDPHVSVTITGVDTEGVGKPKNDGSRGSALYAVPFKLSAIPDDLWAEIFAQHWNSPPRFTTMHRPGIASVSGGRIVLAGTTMDEVEKYHVETLRLVVDVTNRDRLALAEQQDREREAEMARVADHERSVDEIAERLRFDR